MPKFPVVSGKYLMKFLELKWFKLMRVVWSHHVYTKNETWKNITTVVLNHRELLIWTLKWILKQAVISDQDFLDYFHS